MPHSVFRHFTYANVMATVVALTIPTGVAVGAVHLGKGEVTTASIRSKAVTTAKLANNAVTSSQVKNGSLSPADLKKGTIPVVPAGSYAFTELSTPLSTTAPTTVLDTTTATYGKGGPITVTGSSVLLANASIPIMQSGAGTADDFCHVYGINTKTSALVSLRSQPTSDLDASGNTNNTAGQTGVVTALGAAQVMAGTYRIYVTCSVLSPDGAGATAMGGQLTVTAYPAP